MKLIVVAVRDAKAAAFMAPAFVQTLGLAVRSFGEQINGREPTVSKYPGDFDLYEIGTYDDQTALLDPCIPPKVVVTGLSCVERVASPGQLSLVKE